MLREQLHDALAVRRFDDMRHEYFFAERGDVHFAAFGQAVSRPYDQHQGVAVKLRGSELALLRYVGDHANIELMIQELARHLARKHPMHANLHAGMQVAVAVERWKQGVDRAFVDAE